MRLLSVQNLLTGAGDVFKNIYDPEEVKYAVLSHRWANEVDEVTYLSINESSAPANLGL